MPIGTIAIIAGVVLLILLKLLSKDKGFHGIDHEDFFKEDPDVDPSWSVLSSNTHHTNDD